MAITSPIDGSELTKRTDVIGSVSGGNWALQYVLGGQPDIYRDICKQLQHVNFGGKPGNCD